MITDKAIIRGWIPEELPKSSFEIYEWHELNNNVECGSFLYNKDENYAFLQKLIIVDRKLKLRFRFLNSRDEWHGSQKIRIVQNLLDHGIRYIEQINSISL